MLTFKAAPKPTIGTDMQSREKPVNAKPKHCQSELIFHISEEMKSRFVTYPSIGKNMRYI